MNAGYWVMPTGNPATMFTMKTAHAAISETTGAVRHHHNDPAEATTSSAENREGSWYQSSVGAQIRIASPTSAIATTSAASRSLERGGNDRTMPQ